ncbi:hypothetical protein GCM10009841_21860 [Microlunatus panaciterrae]|uniref:non-specific serine/threonine protein kinase n=1 Tax=Microlunatus panaciterrae TaxID=400768 RepID=A0ABS2RP01_9ACTN|nr:protein kinase [Microlunatus panaciterrae]MBM7800740.1 hypothetical protein [Microlunatus panaciterrae]
MAGNGQGGPTPGSLHACLLSNSVVIASGRQLMEFRPLPDAFNREQWTRVSELDGAIVALGSSRLSDRDPGEQILVVTEVDGQAVLMGWTHSGPGESSGTGWHESRAERVDLGGARVTALAVWIGSAGRAEKALLTDRGELVVRLQDGQDRWRPVGFTPGAISLDAAVADDGSLELFCLDAEGHLHRVLRDGGGRWHPPAMDLTLSGQRILAHASWGTGPTASQRLAVLDSGQQVTSSRTGVGGWGPWFPSRQQLPAPLGRTIRALSGAGADAAGGAEVGAVTADGRFLLRHWIPVEGQSGWENVPLPWSRPVPARDGADEATVPTASGRPPATLLRSASTQLARVAAATAVQTDPARAGADPASEPAVAFRRAPRPAESNTLRPATQTNGTTPPATAHPSADHPRHDGSEAWALTPTVLLTGRDFTPLEPGDPERFGPFSLLQRVRGGQDSTEKFIARDGRGMCFLKVLRDDAQSDHRAAFERESMIAQRVLNCNQLSNYIDHSERRGEAAAYLALSFVEGEDLETHLLKRGPLAGDKLLKFAYELLGALEEMEDVAIAHCDIKPSNVILAPHRRPVVVDYGCAFPLENTQATAPVFATREYAPPEFIDHWAISTQTDVYSWGAVVMKAALGEIPAADDDRRAAQLRRLPEQLRDLVAASLSADPQGRLYRNALAAQLARNLHQPAPTAKLETVTGVAPVTIPRRVLRGPAKLRQQVAELPVNTYRLIVGGCAVLGSAFGIITGAVVSALIGPLGGG